MTTKQLNQLKQLEQLKQLKSQIETMVHQLDLNYRIAMANRLNKSLVLVAGLIEETRIEWTESVELPLDYTRAYAMLEQFVLSNRDHIIKIKTECNSNEPSSHMSKSIVIYVPYDVDMSKLKKKYVVV